MTARVCIQCGSPLSRDQLRPSKKQKYCSTKCMRRSPSYRVAHSTARQRQWQDAAYRATAAERMRRKWQNPHYRAAHFETMYRSGRWRKDLRPCIQCGKLLSRIQLSRSQKAKYCSRECWLSDPTYRLRLTEITKSLWRDPNWREKQMTRRRDPDARAKSADNTRRQWQDPVWRAKRLAAYQDSAWSAAAAYRWENCEYRAAVSMGHRRKWQDPVWRAKRLAAYQDPVWRAKLAERWQDPEYRAKIIKNLCLSREQQQDPKWRTRWLRGTKLRSARAFIARATKKGQRYG